MTPSPRPLFRTHSGLLAATILGLSLAVPQAQAEDDFTPPTAPAEELSQEQIEEQTQNQTGAQTEEQPAETSRPAAVLVEEEPEEPSPPVRPLAEVEEESEAPPASATRSVRRRGRDFSVPYYQQKKPRWALQIAASARSALGASSGIGAADAASLRGLQIQGDYQPEWAQEVGVLAVGASLGVYTTSPSNTITSSLAGLLSYGYNLRYEARYLRNQWVVPTLGFSGDWLRYNLKSGASGTVGSHGLTYGAMILLSALDEASAAEMYNGYGISRVYLLAEGRQRSGSDSALTLAGTSYFFGLRFEF